MTIIPPWIICKRFILLNRDQKMRWDRYSQSKISFIFGLLSLCIQSMIVHVCVHVSGFIVQIRNDNAQESLWGETFDVVGQILVFAVDKTVIPPNDNFCYCLVYCGILRICMYTLLERWTFKHRLFCCKNCFIC